MVKMITLSEQQCVKLDKILDLFKTGELVDSDFVLGVEANERMANSLISILVGRGFVTRLGDTEESPLPMAIQLQPHAQLFMENGGFLQELRNAQKSSSTGQNITITANGSNHVINTGNHNSINVQHTFQGNLDILKKRLSENAVPTEDIYEISNIVMQEIPENGKFGPRVKEWIGKMFNKSLSGVWEISMSAAAGILSEIINNYYGIQ